MASNKTKTIRSGIIFMVLFAPTIVLAQVSSFKDLANLLVKILNASVVLIITLAIVIYFAGAIKRIWDVRSGKVNPGEFSKYFGMGLGILFVMISIWGIIDLVQYTLFGSPQGGNGGGSSGNSENLQV